MGGTMYKKSVLSITILLTMIGLPFLTFAKQADVPVSQRGILDVADWNFAEKGTIQLQGEWELYWQQLLEPDDFLWPLEQTAPCYVPVPSIWSKYYMDGEPLSNQGFATYRLIVSLNANETNGPMSLYLPSIATSYKLWINGELAAESGVVGANKQLMIAHDTARVVPILTDDSKLELIIQVSNFVQRKGGMWKAITLGPTEQIVKYREIQVMKTLGFAIGLFVMGVYHFFLYFPYRLNRSPLLFGLLCFAVGIRMLFVGEIIAVYWFPDIPWELATKIEYISANSALLFLLLFVSYQFPLEVQRKTRNILLFLEGAFILFVIITPAIIYTRAMMVQETLIVLDLTYMLVIFILATKRKREGALINLLGLIFIFIAVLNDIFMYEGWIRSIDLSAAGLFVYLFAQSLIMSIRFERSFIKVETLSNELKQVNQNLEQKIEERTASLRHANDSLREVNSRLAQMEESRKRLFSNISHEMGNPLTSLQGYLHAVEDGLVQVDTTKYFSLIRDKIRFLDQMIHDLVELSRIETNQILFQYHHLNLYSFVKQLFEKYELDVMSKGVQYTFDRRVERLSPLETHRATIDPQRMEQVFVNLLFNALRYTPIGGTITVIYEIDRYNPDVELYYAKVSIHDTGPGIAPEDIPYVFERFYKGSADHELEESRGLGLSIAKEIVEHHGGSIGVESVLGEGSIFYFQLPIHITVASESN